MMSLRALLVVAVAISLDLLTTIDLVDAQQQPLLRTRPSVDASADATAKKAAGDFDFYVLSMSFQPEFCFQHQHSKFPGCEHPHKMWKSNLTIHGLWPQNNDGTWPSTCSNEKFNPQTVDDLGLQRFLTDWPNVKATPANHADYYEFYNHEWTKHGTCSGLVQDDYFDTALQHFLPTPAIVGDNYGKEIKANDLRAAYRTGIKGDSTTDDDVVLICSKGRKSFLSEIRICIAKDSRTGKASHRINCITEVKNEENCNDIIEIPKFYIEENENENDNSHDNSNKLDEDLRISRVAES